MILYFIPKMMYLSSHSVILQDNYVGYDETDFYIIKKDILNICVYYVQNTQNSDKWELYAVEAQETEFYFNVDNGLINKKLKHYNGFHKNSSYFSKKNFFISSYPHGKSIYKVQTKYYNKYHKTYDEIIIFVNNNHNIEEVMPEDCFRDLFNDEEKEKFKNEIIDDLKSSVRYRNVELLIKNNIIDKKDILP